MSYEFFEEPAQGAEGREFGGKADKIYRYGPTREIEVEVFNGRGVVVTYVPTLRCVSWDWKRRSAAFAWAQSRNAHQRAIGWR